MSDISVPDKFGCAARKMSDPTTTTIRDTRGLAVALVLLAFIICMPSLTFACSCMAYPEDEAKAVAIAFARADVIFLGTVSAVKSKRFRPLAVRDATFDVLSVWKGQIGRNLTVVRAAIGVLACGYKFRKSGNYLVFANWDAEQEILWTNMCELTREQSKAQGLIRELDKLKESEP